MRRRKATDHFDLLPFIAILMCTLGTLLLVTLCMAAINLGPGAGEAWIPTPDPNQKTKIPILFQWDGDVLTAQQLDGQPLRFDIPLETLGQASGKDEKEIKALGEQLEAELGRLKSTLLNNLARQKDTHYALFAVRPSGFKSFGYIRSLFREHDITMGKEPIDQGKPVRLAREEKHP